MITLFRSDRMFSPEEAKEYMASQIKQLPQKFAMIGSLKKILRFELLCEPLVLLPWLNNQSLKQKLYWSDRDNDFEVAAIGIADCLKEELPFNPSKIFNCLKEKLSEDNPFLRYYGGLSFSPENLNSEWQAFGSYQFFVPRFEILHSGPEWLFAFNILTTDITEKRIAAILTELKQINFTVKPIPSHVPAPLACQNFPSKEIWDKIFLKIQNEFINKEVEKVVLAKKAVYSFENKLNPIPILNLLKEKTPGCFHFCFMPASGHAFLGASPERFYKRVKNTIQTEALAGTKAKGKNILEDEHNKQELLSSPKNKKEHQYVVDFIKHVLKGICDSIEYDKSLSLFEQNTGHHLITRFKGILKSEIGDDRIFTQLHPTPAVGGCPKDKAIEMIKDLEPFNRGWYAGTVGYIGYDSVELCVAIRSGLMNEKTLSLFAGAGVVQESTSQEEWEEIEQKMKNFAEVLN